ncbi:MAG: PDZ domain-containing protein, partial [Woeseiaceae bacterium]|nr:PDZ domain-containing protein [Woeseiaceae bacterium]
MKHRVNGWLLIAALLIAGHASAQEAERAAEMAAREAEFAERMREAEERLAEAARQVAELSSERLGSVGDVRRFAFDFSGRPRLGVSIGDGSANAPVEGVSVVGVTPGSAAADAGLRAGDVLTSVNGEGLSAENARAANEKLLDFMTGVEEGDKLDIE